MSLKACYALPLLSLLALAASCGNSGTSSMTATPNPFNFSGNWDAHTTLLSSMPIVEFLGALTASNGVVSGTLTPIAVSSCATSPLAPTSVSGTIDASGNLTISLPVAGGTATLTAPITPNLNTLVGGNYQIVGGTCAMSSAPMVIAEYAPITGTYTGTLTALSFPSNPGNNISVTAVLTQSATPNGIGAFPESGTVTASGACAATFSLSGAYVWGATLLGGGSMQTLGGSFDPTGATAQLAVFSDSVASSGCPNAPQIFAGPLTRQ